MLSWQIGDVKITRVVELETERGNRFILPMATAEALAPYPWLKPHFVNADGKLILSIHALIVETRERKIMVDTCLGNDKERPMPLWTMRTGPFLADIAEAGYPRESIDMVMCTHLHVDHVGWNTMLVDGKWQPTFPNARYLMAEAEFTYWRDQPMDGEDSHGDYFGDSVQPVFDAGLVDLVDIDAQICPEIRLEPTPGHTPGHVSVHITSAGEEAIITGDFMHHPCQIARPDWCSTPDTDPDQATRTRHAFFEKYADQPVLIIGTHFSGPTAGRLVRDGEVYRFEV